MLTKSLHSTKFNYCMSLVKMEQQDGVSEGAEGKGQIASFDQGGDLLKQVDHK